MKKMIEDLINGNLTDAKRRARRYSWEAIFKALWGDWDHSKAQAVAAADFLKGKGSFQTYCDAL